MTSDFLMGSVGQHEGQSVANEAEGASICFSKAGTLDSEGPVTVPWSPPHWVLMRSSVFCPVLKAARTA